ncbi:MAG: YfhO family protein, partial [Candidatus Omnitrophota bacterium]
VWICLRFCIIALIVLLIKVSYVPVFTLFKGFEVKDFYFSGLGGVVASVIVLSILAFIFTKPRGKKVVINTAILLSLLELWFCIPKGTGCIGSLLKFAPFLLGLLAVFLVLYRKKRVGIYLFGCCALLFILIDIFSPMGFPAKHNIFKEPEYIDFLKKGNNSFHRIMGCGGILFPNFASVFSLPDIRYAGSSAPTTFRYYVDNYLNNRESYRKGLWFSGINRDNAIYKQVADNLVYYSFVGVKYILTPGNVFLNLPKIYNKDICIYENPYVLPRTYVVHNVRFAENFEYAQAQIAKISDLLGKTAYIEAIPPDWFKNLKFSETDFSKIKEYGSSKIRIEVGLRDPGLLVLTDLYYPGWKVAVDGKKSRIYRVNGLVRGVFVQAGEHNVVYAYSPFSWRIGLLFIFGLFLFFTPIIKLIRLMEDRLRRRKYLICAVFIAVLPFIVYANSMGNDFLAGDDEGIIQRNVYLNDWKYLPNFFSENYKQGAGIVSNYWRPFQLIVYSLIVHSAGRWAPLFHFSSLLFHSLSGIFLFLILLNLFPKSTPLSLWVLPIAIWLVHPVHNEEMSLISGIASSSHIFWILFAIYAFLIFIKKGKRLWYGISIAGCIVALTCKESAVIFPGLILAVHIVSVRLGIAEKKSLKEYVFLHSPFWAVMFLYVLLRLTVLNFNNTLNFYAEDNVFTQNFLYRIYTCLTVVGHGIRITLLPFKLYPERNWSVYTSIFTSQVYVSFLVVSGLGFCAFKFFKKNPLVSFGIFWFFFSYVPMSNIVAKINSLVWDHWFCLPSIGLFVAVAALAEKLKDKRVVQGLMVIVLIVFSVTTFFRNMCWKDTESRSRFILAYQPLTAKTWNNLAMVLAEKGNDENAIAAYKRSIELSDAYSQTHHNLANIYRDR